MNKTSISIIAILVVIIGGYLVFSGGNSIDNTVSDISKNTKTVQSSKTSQIKDVPKEIVVEIKGHKIVTPTLTVQAGDTVKFINRDNLDGLPYDTHSPTSGEIDSTGKNGESGVVPNSGSGIADGEFSLNLSSEAEQSFTFEKVGTYTYYIAEHPMVSGEGKIIVTEKPIEVISMESGGFFFTPNVIKAKVGEEVLLDVESSGLHTFTIDELGVDVRTPNGKTTRVAFTPNKKGTFQFYCAIPGHREAGQVGTIVIE